MFPDKLLISSKRPSFNNGPFSPTARVAGTYWIVCFNSSILCMRVLLPLLFAPAITVMGARSTAILSLNDLKFLIDHFFSMLRAQSCSVGTYTLESSRLVARLKRNFFGPQAPASARNGNNVMPKEPEQRRSSSSPPVSGWSVARFRRVGRPRTSPRGR